MTSRTNTRYDSESFLPDFCNLQMAFVVITMAELLALILTLSHSRSYNNLLELLAFLSLFIQWIALSCSSVLCLANRFLSQLSNRTAAVIAYLIVLLTAAVVIELSYWVFSQWVPIININSHEFWLIQNISISAITAAIALRYFYVRNQWRLNLELQAQARLQALQARIRPHFFFNCMNSIASLTRSQPKLAEQAVEDLADLFRASLMNSEQLIPIEEEIALCQRYLNIEQLRFGDRLNTEWHLQLPTEMMIPPLLLQPLIENAIYHGIESLPEGGTILIKAMTEGGQLQLVIENPFAEKRGKPSRVGNHMAQDNIRQRLSSLYGEQAEFNATTTASHYTVRLNLPVQTGETS